MVHIHHAFCGFIAWSPKSISATNFCRPCSDIFSLVQPIYEWRWGRAEGFEPKLWRQQDLQGCTESIRAQGEILTLNIILFNADDNNWVESRSNNLKYHNWFDFPYSSSFLHSWNRPWSLVFQSVDSVWADTLWTDKDLSCSALHIPCDSDAARWLGNR